MGSVKVGGCSVAMRRLFLPLLLAASAAQAQPQVLLPRTGLTADEVAILVNEEDALSRQAAEYYAMARGIPQGNVIRLRTCRPTRWRGRSRPVRLRWP
jgi:hypothetical protein